jgi:hypothetical protein
MCKPPFGTKAPFISTLTSPSGLEGVPYTFFRLFLWIAGSQGLVFMREVVYDVFDLLSTFESTQCQL